MGSQACTNQVRCAADPLAQLAVMQSFRGGSLQLCDSTEFDNRCHKELTGRILHESSVHKSSMLRCRSTSAAAVMQRFRGDSLHSKILLCACLGFVSQTSKHSERSSCEHSMQSLLLLQLLSVTPFSANQDDFEVPQHNGRKKCCRPNLTSICDAS